MLKFLTARRALIFFIVSLFTSSLFSALAMELCVEEEKHSPTKWCAPQDQGKVDATVSDVAQRVYDALNENWTYPPPGSPMQTESKYWEARWIDGTCRSGKGESKRKVPTLVFQGQPDQLEKAFEDLIRTRAALECTIARTLAQIACLRALLGREHFNLYASRFYRLLQTTEGWSPEEFFHELVNQFLTTVEGPAKPGSFTRRQESH